MVLVVLRPLCPFESRKGFGKILWHGRCDYNSDRVFTSSSASTLAKRGGLIVCDVLSDFGRTSSLTSEDPLLQAQ